MRALTIAAVLLAAPAAAPATAPAWAQEAYDCVIEPYVVVEIGSAVEGIIAEIDAERGTEVTKGQVLARLESSVEEATLRMAEANAASTVDLDIATSRVKQLSAEVDRATQLASQNVVSQSVLEAAQSELEQALLEQSRARQNQEMAGLDRDRAKAQLERRVIRSPVDGMLLRRLIGPGEYVYSQAQVAQLATIDPLHVEVFMPTDLFPDVKPGQTATVQPAEPIGGSYRAKIISIDQVFDAASDTFGMLLELPNPDNKLPAGVDCELFLDRIG